MPEPFDCVWVAVVAAALWACWVPISYAILRNPKGSISGGLAFPLNLVYTTVWHRTRASGLEHIPGSRSRTADGVVIGAHAPLVVIANHTAGIDPMLVQRFCPFYIRWMMTSEMRIEAFNWLWEWLEIIFVGGDGSRSGASELAALKETMRLIRSGGVLGIFPEGRLERPPGVLHPFQPGIGLIIARTGASVLPVIITGTPRVNTAWGSLWRMSSPRVRFMPVVDYKGWKADAIVADLQARYEGWLGWAVVEPGAVSGLGSED